MNDARAMRKNEASWFADKVIVRGKDRKTTWRMLGQSIFQSKARKDISPDYERDLHRHMHAGAESHTPNEAGQPEIAIKTHCADDHADIVEDW